MENCLKTNFFGLFRKIQTVSAKSSKSIFASPAVTVRHQSQNPVHTYMYVCIQITMRAAFAVDLRGSLKRNESKVKKSSGAAALSWLILQSFLRILKRVELNRKVFSVGT